MSKSIDNRGKPFSSIFKAFNPAAIAGNIPLVEHIWNLTNVDIDPLGEIDLANDRWSPQRSGWYYIGFNLAFNLVTANSQIYLIVRDSGGNAVMSNIATFGATGRNLQDSNILYVTRGDWLQPSYYAAGLANYTIVGSRIVGGFHGFRIL